MSVPQVNFNVFPVAKRKVLTKISKQRILPNLSFTSDCPKWLWVVGHLVVFVFTNGSKFGVVCWVRQSTAYVCTRPARSPWLHSGQGEFNGQRAAEQAHRQQLPHSTDLPVTHRFFSRRIKGRSRDVVSYLLALSLILCSQENSDGIQAFRYATYYTVTHCTTMQHVCRDAEINKYTAQPVI